MNDQPHNPVDISEALWWMAKVVGYITVGSFIVILAAVALDALICGSWEDDDDYEAIGWRAAQGESRGVKAGDLRGSGDLGMVGQTIREIRSAWARRGETWRWKGREGQRGRRGSRGPREASDLDGFEDQFWGGAA